MRWTVLVFLLGCTRVPAVAPERMSAMREAKDEDSVKGCTLLGRFVGSSTQPGDQGLSQARDEARAKCAATGATDYFVDRESLSPDVITVAAKAYDCGGQR